MSNRVVRDITPLCPAGHLPLKEGDWLTRTTLLTPRRLRLVANFYEEIISLLAGEMPGRAEGGENSRPPLHFAEGTT
ncbi:lytic murein transglycosylase [Phyllobacterium phragmitis]|uniref:Lytic murein transglycosylase n=1 Tax=Phyllobacterium phragmitis TaxID=2670329 RepID=A0A2S9IM93_9HYPH|nr:lytic murein transglycosylase [Phyllobacterium phragmitis]